MLLVRPFWYDPGVMPLPPIPDLSLTTTNLETFGDFIHTLKQGAIAFIGAGVSIEAGYPSWKKLLDQLHVEAHQENPKHYSPREWGFLQSFDDMLWRAEEYRSRMGPARYRKFMSKTFRKRTSKAGQNRPTAEAIARLPFKHYITTNYDPLIEQVCASEIEAGKMDVIEWNERIKLQTFLRNSHNAKPHLLYLHGRFDLADSLILTESDYVKRYAASDDASRKLFALFAAHRLVFLGFSLSDPDLMFLLRSVNAAYADLPPQHFVIAPLIPEQGNENILRRHFEGKRGVRPVFYNATEANPYQPLPEFLRSIEAWVKLPKLPTPQQIVAGLQKTSQVKSRPVTREFDPEDPLKGTANGLAELDGIAISATVDETNEEDWFEIAVTVTASAAVALGKEVTFHVHPTFPQDQYKVAVAKGKAVWKGHAVGAFTIVAETETGTKVELDLAELESAPKRFRER